MILFFQLFLIERQLLKVHLHEPGLDDLISSIDTQLHVTIKEGEDG